MKRLTSALVVIGAFALAIGLAAAALAIHRGSHGRPLDAAVVLGALGAFAIAVGLFIRRHERRTAAQRREEAGEALAELFSWPRAQRRQIIVRDHRRAKGGTLVLPRSVPAEPPVSPWAMPEPRDTIADRDEQRPMGSERTFSSDVITELMRRPTEG
jgi:hypothetical protein